MEILTELSNFVDNYFIFPILIAALISSVMNYYKTKFEDVGEKYNPLLREIIQWVVTFVFSLGIVLILIAVWILFKNIINSL